MIANRYSLDREIGRGGMGAVWLGRDETLGRLVALKRVGIMPGGGEPDLERAAREARLAASLNHPHVVGVYDLVHEDGHQWLVMEYVDGETLAQLVQRSGRLSADQLAPILGQCAEALAAAHAAGIVHRDVKPSNILITRDGVAKLTDFGIARAEADAQLTQTGLVTGSPAYLAPEVASGGGATTAADVWSLGATAYHALEGRPPLEIEGNLVGALYRLVHEEPPTATDPGWLAPLLAGTFVKDPARRWSMPQVLEFLTTRTAPAAGTAVTPAMPAAAIPVPAQAQADDTLTLRAAAPVRERRRLPGIAWALIAMAAVVVLLVVAVLLGNQGTPSRQATKSGTSSPPSSPSSSATQPTQPAHTAAELQSYIADYLALATSDPTSAFQQLTPAFQQASHGLSGYRGWWDRVRRARLTSFSADPQTLTVTYDVAYTLSDGSKSTDHVRLQLVDHGGTLLIDREA